MELGLSSDCGKVRDINEDSYLQLDNSKYKIFAVADGMGGHNAGELASSIAIDVLKDYNFDLENMSISLTEAIQFINKKILNKARSNVKYEGMGTTLTTAILVDDQLYIGHVGDSRIYLLRDGEFKQLTEDHSLVNQLVKAKEITSNEARNHPQSHILLQALGTEERIDIDIIEMQMESNDLILLCTDGLNSVLKDDIIKKVLLDNQSLQEKADRLIQMANKAGGQDNITVNLFTR
ncbi:Stp1/IreP family PP2C-type Ser/Thr phosphatase [Selenihalanaerobacter shriftii]|uniref:Protein phosphatase n=1 Tax=Selenihalanaerobacter shriftii TaxID=142842 RepID=A0A1T4JL30_9FIRM|nr:Stp1/IreP family PP2C-type Ser/Thr phosphatase [Selenihalanaerobacter shriftii]SJZ30885.1 protein phosphatase [Selenihalanaerobacter shriftii]